MMPEYPTIRLTCPEKGCDHEVGPYYFPDNALRSLNEHVYRRHQAIRQALPAIAERTQADGT